MVSKPYLLLWRWPIWRLLGAAMLLSSIPVFYMGPVAGMFFVIGGTTCSVIARALWSREKQFPFILLDSAIRQAIVAAWSAGKQGFDSAHAFQIYQTIAVEHGMQYPDRSAATDHIRVKLAEVSALVRVFGKVPSFAHPELDHDVADFTTRRAALR